MGESIEDVFLYCPICGEKGESIGKIPFVCHHCGFHHFFSPANAVGALIADKDDRLLLITRGKDPGKGKLGMPGGFVDIGETAEQAVSREVLEEVGLTLTSCQFLATFPNNYEYRGIATRVLDLFFVCQVESFEDLVVDPEEVSGHRFVYPDQNVYREMAFESNRKAVQLFAELFLP